MTLLIENKEIEELAETVADLAGETKTEAVEQALRDRLMRLRRQQTPRRLVDELDQIALHCASLPVLDSRPADDIVGNDLPTQQPPQQGSELAMIEDLVGSKDGPEDRSSNPNHLDDLGR